jgi:hypothetical protein
MVQTMRTFFALLLLAISPCLAQSAPANSAPQDAVKANSQQAKQVIDKCIAALGGELYLSVKDTEQIGRGYGFYQNTPNGIGTPYWRFYRYPDQERYEFTKKRDVVLIHNGDKGYEVTFRGTALENATDHDTYLRRRKYALDRVLRDWVKQPGAALFYEGTTVVGPKTVHQVTVRNAANEGVTLYIDTNSYLPVKRTYKWRDPKYKDMNTEEESYDEYRLEQGIQTPHVITRVYNGEMQSQRFLQQVKYNVGFPDDLFTPKTLTYDKMKK